MLTFYSSAFTFPPFLLGQVAQIKRFDWLKVVASTAVTCWTGAVEMLSRNKEKYPTVLARKKCLSGFLNVIHLLTFTLIKGPQAAYMTHPFILKMTK